MSKEYVNINVRLRQDSGEKKPSYTKQDIISKLIDGSAEITTNSNSAFIVDKSRNNKIMGVIEEKKNLPPLPPPSRILNEDGAGLVPPKS